jgi:hypothetical protein
MKVNFEKTSKGQAKKVVKFRNYTPEDLYSKKKLNKPKRINKNFNQEV